MSKPFVIIGAGGHGRVVLDLVLALGHDVLGMTDSNADLHGTVVRDVTVKGNDADVLGALKPDDVHLALGIGAAGDDLPQALRTRLAIAAKLEDAGYTFPSLIHPSATVATDVTVDAGVQIMAGAVVQTASILNRHAIINTSASLDHDTTISHGAHIAPGATIGGGVSVGRCAYVGLGASIIHGLSIGDLALIAAGGAVTCDVADNAKVGGVPAKELSR